MPTLSLAIFASCIIKMNLVLVMTVSSISSVCIARPGGLGTSCGWSPGPGASFFSCSFPTHSEWRSGTPGICTPSCRIGQLVNWKKGMKTHDQGTSRLRFPLWSLISDVQRAHRYLEQQSGFLKYAVRDIPEKLLCAYFSYTASRIHSRGAVHGAELARFKLEVEFMMRHHHNVPCCVLFDPKLEYLNDHWANERGPNEEGSGNGITNARHVLAQVLPACFHSKSRLLYCIRRVLHVCSS